MRRRKRYRWNRALFSAASLVLWCQAAGRFGLVADRVALSVLMGKEIYPFCWAMILGLACLITVRQVSLERLMKPSIRTLRGLAELWPEWLILGVILIASGRTRLGWGQGIAIAGGVLCEEAVFRMMFCSDCLRQDRRLEPKTIVLLSASLWSAAHLLNVLGPAGNCCHAMRLDVWKRPASGDRVSADRIGLADGSRALCAQSGDDVDRQGAFRRVRGVRRSELEMQVASGCLGHGLYGLGLCSVGRDGAERS